MSYTQQREYVNGAVRVLNGKYQDAILKLQPKENLIIGRDVRECHLVLEAPWVSRKHCMISYDHEQQMYVVTDYSENGTFVDKGERLTPQSPQHLVSGNVIFIGEDGIALQLM